MHYYFFTKKYIAYDKNSYTHLKNILDNDLLLFLYSFNVVYFTGFLLGCSKKNQEIQKLKFR